ncbi:interleukin-1 receptor-associated kinase 4 isoform X1 [Halyomorpha halys]|uniref:interleukin-1 receptor-associated kinase 4 isoform X1 n=1 Tax=Halyomorpha halys TaxID=286706 RepID=UPI0006D5299B|nr:interleukin-1 receptor-associated kinase 4-like [Halyomorpha halys]
MCNTLLPIDGNLDMEIRKLTAKTVLDLSQILDVEQSWKLVMAHIKDAETGTSKYNVEHINLIEKTSENQKRSSTEILLEEWGTSGRRRPHISDLLNVLVKAELYRAADYVSLQLLKQAIPSRPTSGPAAPVVIPEDILKPSAPPLSLWGSECQKETTPLPKTNDGVMNSDEIVQQVSYKTLQYGTDDFSDEKKIGTGGFGSVYLCSLHFGKVAVKRLHDAEAVIPELTCDQFGTEIKLLGGVAHENILPVIGYSNDGPYKCLIYTFMPNGSLQDALEAKNNRHVLSWQERLQIMHGTARGLDYLHSMDKPLIHRDLKSANVLLDENLVAKVGDFGLVKAGKPLGKVTMYTSTVVGTSAYMAPEAFKGEISTKGDVFSFGVVVLEIITGLPPYDEERETVDLLTYVSDVDDITLLVDKRLEPPNEAFIQGLYELSEKCCLHNKKLRPTMSSVLELISGLEKI